MQRRLRRLILALSVVVTAVAIVVLVEPMARRLALVAAFGAFAIALILNITRPRWGERSRRAGRTRDGRVDPDAMEAVDEARLRELIRGTSKWLRELDYAYSVRIDLTGRTTRAAFTAAVGDVRLGFIPAIITENDTDRQARGFVVMVHDGTRWRGPGLPCPGDPEHALAHASRFVAPLDLDEDFDEDEGDREPGDRPVA